MDDPTSPGLVAAASSATPPGSQETLPSGFAFDQPGDAWLTRVREAQRPDIPGAIGPYEVLEEVSRGGQGIVYRARQPNTNRVIAIKRLLAGAYASPAARVRFRREIDAEVTLDHTNIVGVYGLDVVDEQPVLAMEWVNGLPANRWSAGSGQTPTRGEIIDTFLKICDALRHAHQRGVIHRDLKPSNILVDERGEPHVLDFGLAKLTETPDPEATRLTQMREFVGTPAYAAPEQLRGEAHDIDVRGDVYALGAILYEMLTGQTPYPTDASVVELVELMRRSEPPPLSSHDRTLDDELDAIVRKALAAEPADRYQSVDALSLDLRRYVAGDPIEARRHTFGHVLRKQVKKYRLPATLVTGLVVLATGLLGVALAGWRSADRERAIALRQRAESEAVTGMVRGMLGSPDPHEKPWADLTLRQLLDDFTSSLRHRLPDRPEVEATLRLTIGEAYLGLGLADLAAPHLEAGLRLRRTVYGPTHPLTVEALRASAGLRHARGDDAGARALAEESLTILRAAAGDVATDVAETVALLATYDLLLGHEDSAEQLALEAIERARALGPDGLALVADATFLLAEVHAARGECDRATTLHEEALTMHRRRFGDGHASVATGLRHLADVLELDGRYDRAERLRRTTLAMDRRRLGDGHAQVADDLEALASTLRSLGRFEESEQHRLAALAMRSRSHEHRPAETAPSNVGRLQPGADAP